MPDHLALLEAEVAAMTESLRAADPAAPVASCPGWTVRDLADHVTSVHRWVLATLSSQEPAPFDDTPCGDDLAAGYAEQAHALLDRLTELPPDHECWTFDRNNHTAGFWRRRQVHEISVHRWDLAPYAMSDEVAEDGIDEILEFMLPRQVAMGRTTLPDGVLRLVSPRRTWDIGTGEPLLSVEAPAAELLLSLWGRKDALPQQWRDAKLTP